MRHQHTDHKCELISDCSYSGKTLVEKRQFPDVEKIDQEFDPFHVTFTVTPEEKKKYDGWFNAWQHQAGLLSEKKVRYILRKLLPVSSVDKIWSLSDQDGDGCLDRFEHTVALHLGYLAMNGDPIPDQVVISLIS